MCGINGVLHLGGRQPVSKDVLVTMTSALSHRGPDSNAYVVEGHVGFGFQRLAIIDLAGGLQPFFDESRSIMLICNGEIYNYKELRHQMQARGYHFKTTCDIEVLIPLYLEFGNEFFKKLNGQFAVALHDKRNDTLILARDHFGICPLYYTLINDIFLFGSEIKALLKHPAVNKEVDLTGLDQVFSFPGTVSPTTMFRNIYSLQPGTFLELSEKGIRKQTYWDLNYPAGEPDVLHSDDYYQEKLEDLLTSAVRYRMNADVPVGYYLSGGLDSSLIGALMKKVDSSKRFESFSISFPSPAEKHIDEGYYQRQVARHLHSSHNQISFSWDNLKHQLSEMIYYAESPLKETYNSCSIALSRAAREKNVKVILSGEGADEFFGGYVGYRFDAQRTHQQTQGGLEEMLEAQQNYELWGENQFFYEKKYYEFTEVKKSIYSDPVNERYHNFNSYNRLEIDKSKLAGRNNLQKRSYLDFKLRLCDHLISDHCDRTCYANSVEGRYPFLDINLIEFVTQMPSHLKLNNLVEKFILREIGKKYLPAEIVNRQKQGFVAAGSPFFLKKNDEWVNDLLSFDRIKRQGYFNPLTVERMKKLYSRDGFTLNLPFDSDLLITVLTFNIFLEVFELPDFK